jgi:ubiquinone/menaquinone biosynthesis C-methylase UbiE
VSFDAIAPWYRTLETIAFGNALQRARVACLDEIGLPIRALIVGEGDGRFLSDLLRTHPEIEVDCVDASARMLRLAQQRVERESPRRLGRVRFLHQDITSWEPGPATYDLIVTHFFLDCFPEKQVAEIVMKLRGGATENAIWLLADFRLPPNGFARLRAKTWLALMYRFFRYTAGIEANELVDPSPFLRAAGFVPVRQRIFRSGILKSEAWRNSSPGSAGC